jgi:hypothetical protein
MLRAIIVVVCFSLLFAGLWNLNQIKYNLVEYKKIKRIIKTGLTAIAILVLSLWGFVVMFD